MSIADLIEAMAAEGASAKVIALAVRALEAKDAEIEARKAVARDKKRRQRAAVKDTAGTVPGQEGDGPETVLGQPSKTKGSPRPLPKTQPSIPPSPLTGAHGSTAKVVRLDFERWYAVYPRHVSKGRAEKAFPKALALADVETLIAAAAAYAERKRGVEAQFVLHPATWLNDKAWLDEPEPSSPAYYRQGEHSRTVPATGLKVDLAAIRKNIEDGAYG